VAVLKIPAFIQNPEKKNSSKKHYLSVSLNFVFGMVVHVS